MNLIEIAEEIDKKLGPGITAVAYSTSQARRIYIQFGRKQLCMYDMDLDGKTALRLGANRGLFCANGRYNHGGDKDFGATVLERYGFEIIRGD